jgi:DNA-binding CsgD family transcriptional regulator
MAGDRSVVPQSNGGAALRRAEEDAMTCPTDAWRGVAETSSGFAGAGWAIPAPRRADGRGSSPLPPRALNDRDRELVRHLADGRSTAQIAAAMSVSSNTARTRIRRVEGKLAVNGRHAVVGAARSLGLV